MADSEADDAIRPHGEHPHRADAQSDKPYPIGSRTRGPHDDGYGRAAAGLPAAEAERTLVQQAALAEELAAVCSRRKALVKSTEGTDAASRLSVQRPPVEETALGWALLRSFRRRRPLNEPRSNEQNPR